MLCFVAIFGEELGTFWVGFGTFQRGLWYGSGGLQCKYTTVMCQICYQTSAGSFGKKAQILYNLITVVRFVSLSLCAVFFVHIARRRWLFWGCKYHGSTYRWVQQTGDRGC